MRPGLLLVPYVLLVAPSLASGDTNLVVCETGFDAFEPSFGVSAEGTIVATAASYGRSSVDPAGMLQVQAMTPTVVRSRDGCRTWDEVTPTVAGEPFPSRSFDPFAHVDPVTGRVLAVNGHVAPIVMPCMSVAVSDDLGSSWLVLPFDCGAPPGPAQDHPQLFSGPSRLVPGQTARVLYTCVNRLLDVACAASYDGGLTFGPLVSVLSLATAPACGIKIGVSAEIGATMRDGTVLVPFSACGTLLVASSRDDGLTWSLATIPTPAPTRAGTTASVAADDAGRAYLAWVDVESRLRVASTVDGSSWTDGADVTPPGLSRVAAPTLAARGDGALALAFLATPTVATRDWHAFVAMRSGNEWSFERATPLGDPLARDPETGTCIGAKHCDMGDFFDVAFDGDGRAWAALVDRCPAGCPSGLGPGRGVFVGFG